MDRKKFGPKNLGRAVQATMTLVKISLAKLLGTFYLISFEFSIEFFRQKFLSALKFEMKIDLKNWKFWTSAHFESIYTTTCTHRIFLFSFELSETKISKINFWWNFFDEKNGKFSKIFDTFRQCWNSQIWLDNHNNRHTTYYT